MSVQKTADIMGKTVRLWAPYEPDRRSVGKLIGRENELRIIAAAWLAGKASLPLAPLLVGPPGVGKNRLVYEISQQTGKKLFIFQGHEDVAAEELACSVRFSDEDSSRMEYTASPLVTAMHLGEICFIDEIAKIRPRALALLASVLDERRYIDSNLLGGRVIAKAGFRFIAATNTADLEGNALPAFIRSRLHPVVHFNYPSEKEIEQIVQDQFLEDQDRVPELLGTFWEEWGKLRIARGPSPREAITVFSLASSLSASGRAGGAPGSLEYDSYSDLMSEHVSQAMEDLGADFREG